MILATSSAALVNVPAGGNVDTVLMFLDHFRFGRLLVLPRAPDLAWARYLGAMFVLLRNPKRSKIRTAPSQNAKGIGGLVSLRKIFHGRCL